VASPTDLAPPDLVAQMKRLGLTEYESRILLALLQSPPATAYEMAKRSGVPRPNAYSALEGLEARGAVMPVSEKPVRYAARPPREFFGQILAQTQTVCDSLAGRLETLAAPQGDHYVWTLEGAAEVQAKVAEMIAAAESEIWLKGDTPLLDRHADALREAATRRGVALMIILFGTNPDDYRFTEQCAVFVHEASGVRMGSADNLFTIAIDQTQMLTANDDGGIRAAHTQNRAVVKMALSLIRHDYYMAEIFDRFKEQLDAAFGPHLSRLRTRSFTDEQIGSFREKTGLSD
jgi:sugar-specific transcriptional regulator TrmB